MDEIFDERFFVVWGCGEMKKEEKKKTRWGGRRGYLYPKGLE